jgi:hypothetical protein
MPERSMPLDRTGGGSGLNASRHFDHFISVASWEDRFAKGVERVLGDWSIDSILLFQYSDWKEWSEEPLSVAEGFCQRARVSCQTMELDNSPTINAWHAIEQQIRSSVAPGEKVLVDITTMPRETIWVIFHFLMALPADVYYVYHEPGFYASDWVSKDPGKPRLVYQMSGEAELGKKAVLLVATGFDWNRTAQLMWTFEPDVTLLALQEGDQFENQSLNVKMHEDLTSNLGDSVDSRYDIKLFGINAYEEDRGRAALLKAIQPYLNDSTIIMSSLGPKLSAVALFEIQKAHAGTGLVYAPAGLYNRDYSKDIGSSHYGHLTGL